MFIDMENYDVCVLRFPDKISVMLPFVCLQISQNDDYVCVVDAVSKCYIFSLMEKKYITSIPDMQGVVTSAYFIR